MEVAVIRPGELGPAECARWRALQHSNPLLDNPFLAPEFTLAVGHARSNARVGVLESGGEVVGFFPYELQGPRVARAIGLGLSDCQGLVHAEGWDPDPQALLKGCRLAVWEFDHLIADQELFAPYHALRYASPIMDLSSGYEGYVENRQRASKKTVKATFAKARKLEREVGEVRFDFDVRNRDELELLMRWKSAQYRRTLRHDRFAKRWIVRLVEDLFANRTSGCSATLSMLYVGGRPIAGHLGLRSETVLACWFPAYDVEFAKYSPGLLLHFRMAEAAAACGIHYLDLGKGQAAYKESLANSALKVAEGWVERSSPIALLRRVQRAPRHYAVNYIMSRPALLNRARRTLKQLGRVRGLQ
jgi:CelD/BcsL family acetyltransferase involved in cellulose biosynthesis